MEGSQTFPEGKGVETSLSVLTSLSMILCRRPSQKVKVLKHPLVYEGVTIEKKSQTFPEGKGVETPLGMAGLTNPYVCRRPSQKVKVLKPFHTLYKPPDRIPCRRPSQKVKVLKLTSLFSDCSRCSRRVADLPRR